MKRNAWVVVLVLVAVLAGCSRRQPPAQPDPQPTTPAPTQPQPEPERQPPMDNTAADRDAERRRVESILMQIVHFDYDEATIRADAQELLAAKVPVLRANPAIRLRIEGHADERGSVEYNLALGMRRAQAVRQYLADFGIDGARFDTFSFGEDRPMAQGSSESAYAQNRRAEFRVTAGL